MKFSSLLFLLILSGCEGKRSPTRWEDLSFDERSRGSWQYVGERKEECPEIIHFDEKDNSYYIYNLCWQSGRQQIEVGQANASMKDSMIRFYNRKFIDTTYHFRNSSMQLEGRIIKFDSTELRICFDSVQNCQLHIYRRVPE
jgi:hypothetical protein